MLETCASSLGKPPCCWSHNHHPENNAQVHVSLILLDQAPNTYVLAHGVMHDWNTSEANNGDIKVLSMEAPPKDTAAIGPHNLWYSLSHDELQACLSHNSESNTVDVLTFMVPLRRMPLKSGNRSDEGDLVGVLIEFA